MRIGLVNQETGFIVAEYNDSTTIFHDRYLQAEIEETGVSIPTFLQTEYGGKNIVRTTDELFQKAFREVYVKFNRDTTKYKWEEITGK